MTELKTVDGYNLLAAPIEFTLQNGKCLINGETQNIVEGTPADGYTVSLTINNRKGFTLPHTGVTPSLWLLIGLPLLVAGLLVLVFRYNRKGGKRS
ncbi:MAG: LPXTG cell wall anchor domain-containing protein [Gemmiger formicilis]|uniref:LPXTG cell wall anchor domain-containing protein n=1 Tax=Gemmiger formicilis TaxID=745368 RepID=UPI003992CBDB